jgi:TP901 family phage tail tape measure protein
MADREFGVKINADTSGFVAGLSDSEKAMRGLEDTTEATKNSLIDASAEMAVSFTAQKLGLTALLDGFETLVTSTALVDAGFGILRDTLGKTFLETDNIKRDGLQLAINFDAARAAAATLTDQSQGLADRMQRLTKEVNFSVTSNELLKASYNVLSDGFTSVNDNAEILAVTTKLSKAGFTDLGTATDAVTGVLNSYKLGVDQAAKVSDILIATQNAGRITVNQYAADIGKVASIASSAGVGLEEMSTFIAVATASGVQANEAITGFRQAIASVLKPSSEAAATAQSMGVEFDAAALKTKGLAGILRELESKGELTQATLLKLFGSVEAVSAITPSAGEGARKYAETLAYVGNTVNLTEKAFQQWAGSLDSEIKKAVNQGQEIFLNFGIGVQKVVQPLVQLVNTMLSFRNSIPKEAIQALGSIATIFGAILAAAAAALPVMVANFAITKLLGGASAAAGGAMAGFAGFIANANAQLVAMQLQMAGVNVGAASMGSTVGLAGLKLVAADIAISGFNAATTVGTGIMARFAGGLKALGLLALEFGKFVLASVGQAVLQLGLLYAAVSAVGAAFTAIKNTGFGGEEAAKARELQAAIEKLTGSLNTGGESTNFFDSALQKASKGMDRSNGLIDSLIIGMVNFDSAIQGTRDASDKFGEDTTQSLKLVTQAQRDAVSSTLAFAQAMVSVNKVFDVGVGILGKYGVTTLEASDKTRLGAEGIAAYKKEAEGQLILIKKTIEELRAKNFADKDQEIANKIQIANLDKVARALENGVSFLESNTDATKANSAQSFLSAEEIKNAYENSNKAIEISGLARLTAIKQQQLDGVISAKDAAQMIATDEIRILQERLKNAEPVIAKLKAQLLGATPEEKLKLEKLITEIEGNAQKDRLKIVESGLSEKIRAEQDAYKQIENIQKSAIATATAAEKQRQIAVQELLNQGVITKAEAESRNLQATQNRINQEIEAEKFKLQALEALPTSNDPAKETERNAKIAEARSKLTDLTLSYLKTVETAQQQVIDAAIRALDDEGKRIKLNGEQRISANLAVLNLLKSEQELFTARNSLEEAQANLGKTRLDNQIKIAQALGDEVTAQKLKNDGYVQEIASQGRIFAAQQKSLEITQQIRDAELQRQRILDEIAIKESEIGLAKLKQKKDVTDGELELQTQIIKLNREKLADTEQAIVRQGVINGLKKEELSATQQTTAESTLNRGVLEAIKLIQEGQVDAADQLVTSLGLTGTAAQTAANQTGQIYLELEKANGQAQIFGGALDGATVEIGNILGEVFSLNEKLGQTSTIGDAIGSAFAGVNAEIGNINQALIDAIKNAKELAMQRKAAASNSIGSSGGTSRDYIEGLLGDNPLTGIVFQDKSGSISNPDDIARAYVSEFENNLAALQKVTGVVGDFGYQAEVISNKIQKSYRDANISLLGGVGGRFNDLNRTGLGLATGGYVRGQGTATSDSIPAMLSNGEYVINAQATAKNKALLDSINAGIKMPKFFSGGFVSGSKSKDRKKGKKANVSFTETPTMPKIEIRLPPESAYMPGMIGQSSANSFRETYSEFERGTERITENLGNFSSSLNTITRTISESVPRIANIRAIEPSRINPPRQSNIKVPGAIAAQSMSSNNTINIVNRPEPELDVRNALIQLGRAR